MAVNLPAIIKEYIDTSNRHDVNSILSCFADDALVQDEGEALQGKKGIQAWIIKTIEQYNFQFKPISMSRAGTEIVVVVEVSRAFDGSPITLDYHFTIANGHIVSLAVA